MSGTGRGSDARPRSSSTRSFARSHDHDDDGADGAAEHATYPQLPDGVAHLLRRTRGKAVHVAGDPALGQQVTARIEHAGAYAPRCARLTDCAPRH